MQDESAIIDLSSGSTKFRSISVKSYYQNENNHLDNLSSNQSSDQSIVSLNIEFSHQLDQTTTDPAVSTALAKRERGRSRKFPASVSFMLNTSSVQSPFTASRAKEIVELLKKGVFESINKGDVSTDVRIFSSRFVDEIKHSNIEKAFEKSRLMMQAFKDQNKTLVLIQSLTIQRISQRLILCLAVTFYPEMNVYLRDITQTYVQSATSLNRDFYVQSSAELIKLMGISDDCILKVIKSLYEMPEAENH
jgi:hypothetical protein